MLRKSFFILLAVFLVSGFNFRHTNEVSELPTDKKLEDGWTVAERERNRAEKESFIEKNKKFFKEELCGTGFNPIVVGILKNNPPFSWRRTIYVWEMLIRREKHFDYGINIDFLKDVFQHINKNQFEIAAFSSLKDMEKALVKGELTLAFGLHFNNDPEIAIEYMYPALMSNHIVAAYIKPELNIQNVSELAGLKGAANYQETLGSFIDTISSHNSNIKIDILDTEIEQLYALLLKGEYDYILTSTYTAQMVERTFMLEGKLLQSPTLHKQQLFLAFSSNNRCSMYKDYVKQYLRFIDYYEELRLLFFSNLLKWEELNKIDLRSRLTIPTE